MLFGVVWKYSGLNGQPMKVMTHPEGLDGMDTPQQAQEEGRKILADLAPHNKTAMMPLSVVEVNDQMIDALNACPKVEIDGEDELLFIDVGGLDYWVTQGWWHK